LIATRNGFHTSVRQLQSVSLVGASFEDMFALRQYVLPRAGVQSFLKSLAERSTWSLSG
jgi:hypothetical protein